MSSRVEGRPIDTETSPEASVRQWLRDWETCIRAIDFDAGRAMFEDQVVSFGTFAVVAHGLDELDEQQWRRTWPFIDDFRFDHDTVDVLLSPDRQMATLVVIWSSLGQSRDGDSFVRPGRATIVIRRDTPGGDWRGVHTHFSLNLGVPAMASHQPDARPVN